MELKSQTVILLIPLSLIKDIRDICSITFYQNKIYRTDSTSAASPELSSVYTNNHSSDLFIYAVYSLQLNMPHLQPMRVQKY